MHAEEVLIDFHTALEAHKGSIPWYGAATAQLNILRLQVPFMISPPETLVQPCIQPPSCKSCSASGTGGGSWQSTGSACLVSASPVKDQSSN
eukprot:43763-Eustigmatos_ZCMA.PRE.1